MMSLSRRWQTRMVISLLVLACLGALLPSALGAQSGVPWRAEFFSNPSLAGSPSRVRYDRAINYDWKNDKPDDGVPFDHWSARWTGDFLFDQGEYLFKAYVDDGVRLWVNGQLVIDEWRDQVATLFEKRINLSAGTHSVRVEYYDNIGNAVAMVWWERMTPPTTNVWRAEYFANPWLTGAPVAVRSENVIDYNWGAGSPGPSVPVDGFSARWSATIDFGPSDNYEFSVTVDDGVRIWLDGVLLIDQWRDQAATHKATRFVPQGGRAVVVEYYEATGNAQLKFSWTRVGGAPTVSQTPSTPVPASEVIVDNKDAGFQKGGPSDGWFERAVGYKTHTFWTYNSNSQVYNFGKWIPKLPSAGDYQVFVFIPRQRADTRSARYRIFHNTREDAFWVNQSAYFDAWVSVGTYYFAATGNEYVYLDDVTGEPYASRNIGFDAVKFVRKTTGTAPTSVSPTRTNTPWVVVVTPVASITPIVVTATPVGPTRTPIPPTATPIAPTATPTVPLPTCAIMPVLGFGNIWTTYPTVRSRLGCPVEPEKGIWSAEETFIGGMMFWRSDLTLIYVLYNNGTWQSFADTWESTQPEWDVNIVAPAGYLQPKRGFGKVWREQPGVRSALSWATTPERGLGATWQAYQGGQMLWSDVQGNFVLFSDGTWSHY